ncbi:MAG: 3'(2'),5'-bisphosphate nucleotidase CysQ [Thiovulaceae bacterium]|nr:3'(2'),5'-bisphosphate nucleotidase CysQ [Sulfurimonadaceae bacterium]MDD3817387.1 3'(2'),5'-bisphosphate nucleotidase CysQ [Sulfurimonadaceae bacterium]
MLDSIDMEELKAIALQAGEAIMQIYAREFSVRYKNDASPLTEADLKANEIICSQLQTLYPNIPIMSEENQETPYEIRKNWEYYWCVDPIDGTKEFIKRNGDFTVNIALIHNQTPVAGVVYAPVFDVLYWAKKGCGAYKNSQKLPLRSNTHNEDTLYVAVSRSHVTQETQKFIDTLHAKEVVQISKGSSLKLCMVAAGEADIYPRFGETMEWDTAAGDALVREAGKMSYQYANGEPLLYNKENLLNPWFVVR